MTEVLPAELNAHRACATWRFASYGTGTDRDVAFDAAVDRVMHAAGEAAVAHVDPSLVTTVGGTDTPLTFLQALRAVRDAQHDHEAADGDPRVVFAAAYCKRSSFRRKSLSLPVLDLELTLPDPGPVAFPADALLVHLQSAIDTLEPFPDGPEGAEWRLTIDEVTLRRRVVRSRVKAQRHVGKASKRFAVVHDGTVVSYHPTQSEARRAALTSAKASADDEGTWDVWITGGRLAEDAPVPDDVDTVGLSPLVTVARTKRIQRGVFRIIATQPRPRTKIEGWVFGAAALPPGMEQDELEALDLDTVSPDDGLAHGDESVEAHDAPSDDIDDAQLDEALHDEELDEELDEEDSDAFDDEDTDDDDTDDDEDLEVDDADGLTEDDEPSDD